VNGFSTGFKTSACGAGCAGHNATSKCKTDWDCSLAGTCTLSTGVCSCDAWAGGSDCSYLSFLPVDKEQMGYVDPQHSSWGGNAVLGSDKQYHLFMAEIACTPDSKGSRCGLGGWGSHSQVAHAVSQHPAGPYKRKALVAPPEHHNPTLKVSPVDGSWNLYSIMHGSGPIVWSGSTDEGKSWTNTSTPPRSLAPLALSFLSSLAALAALGARPTDAASSPPSQRRGKS